MRFAFVAGLVDLQIKGVMKLPITIKVDTYVTNNPSQIKKFLKPHDLLAIGSIEANCLLNGSPVIYRVAEVKEAESAHEEIVNLLRDAQAFLTSLWLLQDNSANTELGFAVCQSKVHIHSNSLIYTYTASSGERVVTQIDHARLSEIAEVCRQNFAGIRTEDELELTAFQRESGRINISMRLLQQARSSKDLGEKIANYCSCFEALLSSNSAELSHQLSERAAFLLRTSPEERFEHFKKTKRAYAIRSKVVHGDIVSKKQVPDLRDIARHCDQTARELLMAILGSDELKTLYSRNDSDALDDFMLGRIFGINNFGTGSCEQAPSGVQP